jgi:NADPH-dependent glutamate synthase beta subunit-like oxidoreductase
VKKEALIIGSNVSGLQATLDLADSGIKVHLVESSPFLQSNGETGVPRHELNLRQLFVSRHPNVTVWTNTTITRRDGIPGNFKVELRQNPRYIDLDRCTACGDCIQVCPVEVPGTNRKAIYLAGQPGCMAIDKLGISPCSNNCPGGIHVQGYVALIAQGRFQEAIDLIGEAIPFPGICGRVCTHPCEVNCRRSEIDSPVAVRLLKRFVADWELEQDLKEGRNRGNTGAVLPDDATKKARVAVVGAGPGGMAVADVLNRRGFSVTVFEKLPVIGGMMAVGIPTYRLPREVIDREYQKILDQGVEVRLNTTIGPGGTHTLDDLFEMGYSAICLAVGAHQSQTLGIPGEELPGVIHGIDVLRTINLSQRLKPDPYGEDLSKLLQQGSKTRVAVLGGGNTAMDVSRSLKRLGIDEVTIYYRRTRIEMPAMPEEIEDAEDEGVKIEYLVSPVRVLGSQDYGVTGLECIRMKLGETDSSGRRRPIPIAGSEFVVDVTWVVLAIGQRPDLGFLDPDHGVAITRDNRIQVTDSVFMTSRPGVFAVGDAVTRDKMAVIEAIGMGKGAAAAIDIYLRGGKQDEIPVDSGRVPVAQRPLSESEQNPLQRIAIPTLARDQRRNSFAEVELGYSPQQAIAEAQRCLACGPCSECQACVQVCKPGAIIQHQVETIAKLDVGAILYAGGTNGFGQDRGYSTLSDAGTEGIFHIPVDDPIFGSAGAAQVYLSLIDSGGPHKYGKMVADSANFTIEGQPEKSINPPKRGVDRPNRSGVFVCQCGAAEQGQISRIVDTDAICAQAATWPGVIHSQVLPYSCTKEGAQLIEAAVEAHQLNRIVVAGCTCCSIDQICYSCTYQRVRCKDNLHLFTHPERSSALGTINQAAKFVFVNIREQCAWIHAEDPRAATAKATALVAGSVARAMATPLKFITTQLPNKSVLILGNGSSGGTCFNTLRERNIEVSCVREIPELVQRVGGHYLVSQNNHTWQTSTLVLAPLDSSEDEDILAAFGEEGYRPRMLKPWGGMDTHRPGVYYIDPIQDPSASGTAAAARVIAWLGRIENQPPLTSVVNSARCRACGTCIDICEYGAPGLTIKNGHHTSWIDPAICNSCGTCAAHCPSGAITAGYSTDPQIEAMLSAILARPTAS